MNMGRKHWDETAYFTNSPILPIQVCCLSFLLKVKNCTGYNIYSFAFILYK